MPLNEKQISDLQNSINNYSFPTIHWDFQLKKEVDAGGINKLEEIISNQLMSEDLSEVKNGLANIVYWGNAKAGYKVYRFNRFLKSISDDGVLRFHQLLGDGNVPTLIDIKKLNLPQFSGISFVSKIIAFIDPGNYCVLDLQLSKLREIRNGKALSELSVTTQLPITKKNSKAYYEWCDECVSISNMYFNGKYRAADIERGIFTLIQDKKLTYAREIYCSA